MEAANEFASKLIPSYGFVGRSKLDIRREGQPISTDEFLRRLQVSEWNIHARNQAVDEWLCGDFTAAMEGLG